MGICLCVLCGLRVRFLRGARREEAAAEFAPFGGLVGRVGHPLQGGREAVGGLRQGEQFADGVRAAFDEVVPVLRHFERRVDELGVDARFRLEREAVVGLEPVPLLPAEALGMDERQGIVAPEPRPLPVEVLLFEVEEVRRGLDAGAGLDGVPPEPLDAVAEEAPRPERETRRARRKISVPRFPVPERRGMLFRQLLREDDDAVGAPDFPVERNVLVKMGRPVQADGRASRAGEVVDDVLLDRLAVAGAFPVPDRADDPALERGRLRRKRPRAEGDENGPADGEAERAGEAVPADARDDQPDRRDEQRELEEGTETLEVTMPCLFTMEKKNYPLRLPSLKNWMASKKAVITTLTSKDIPGLDLDRIGDPGSPTKVPRMFPPVMPEPGVMLDEGSTEATVTKLISLIKD